MTTATAFLSFVVTVVFMFALRPVAVAVGLVDLPGGRKRHGAPVPIIGGIAMTVGLGVGTSLIEYPAFWGPSLLGVYLIAVVGTIDDRFDLPPNVRLIAQSCAALLVVVGSGIVVTELGSPLGFPLDLGPFAILFTALFVMTLVNAFNLIDGIDGLAGGLALLAFLALAVVGRGTDSFSLTVLAAAVVCGYLLFNFPLAFNRPVRTFMGDAGSTSLGLIVAMVGIHVTQGEYSRISPTTGLWLVAVPVFDLFSTILRRFLEGRSPFAPDHQHLHHVLIEHGLSKRETLGFMLLVATLLVIAGLLGDMFGVPDGFLLLAWFCAGAAYYRTMRHAVWVVRAIRALRPAKPPNEPPENGLAEPAAREQGGDFRR